MKGSLQVSIPIVKASLTQNFQSPIKNWAKMCILGKMGSNCEILFSGPERHILARNDVI